MLFELEKITKKYNKSKNLLTFVKTNNFNLLLIDSRFSQQPRFNKLLFFEAKY